MINQHEYSLRMKYNFVSDPYLQDNNITIDSDSKPYTLFYTKDGKTESIYEATWYLYITRPVIGKSEIIMYKIYSKQALSFNTALEIHELSRQFGCHITDGDGFIMIPPIYTGNTNDTGFRLQPCQLSTVPVDSHLSYQTR